MPPAPKYQKRLVRTALITTPLIVALSTIPIFLFFDSFPEGSDLLPAISPALILRAIGLILFNVIVLWTINIGLVRYFPLENARHFIIRFLLSLIIGFALMVLFVTLLRQIPGSGPPVQIQNASFKFYPLFGSFINNVFILFMVNLIISQEERSSLRLEVAQLEIANLTAQQEQLKQRIHPHFLFNALSTLIVLIESDAKTALKYASTLSEFLRSSLLLSKKDQNKVVDELKFLEAYLTLQQIRFRDSILFEENIPTTVKDHGKLPVFALQILAENAIKHNALSTKSPLRLSIKYDQGGTLIVSNNIIPKFGEEKASTGLGLQNLGDRYQVMGKSLPLIQQSKEQFTVTIPIIE